MSSAPLMEGKARTGAGMKIRRTGCNRGALRPEAHNVEGTQ